MKISHMLASALIVLFSQAALSSAQQEANQVNDESQKVLSHIQSWDSQKLKAFLSKRIAENQYLLNFLSEHHDQLGQTEMDATYDYFVSSLLSDQKALIFVSENLATIDQAETLKLDQYLSSQPRLNEEVNNTLAHNLQSDNSRALVNRVLYYSLMDKYSAR